MPTFAWVHTHRRVVPSAAILSCWGNENWNNKQPTFNQLGPSFCIMMSFSQGEYLCDELGGSYSIQTWISWLDMHRAEDGSIAGPKLTWSNNRLQPKTLSEIRTEPDSTLTNLVGLTTFRMDFVMVIACQLSSDWFSRSFNSTSVQHAMFSIKHIQDSFTYTCFTLI